MMTAAARSASTAPKTARTVEQPINQTPAQAPTKPATPPLVFFSIPRAQGVPAPVPCSKPDPFKAAGGVGICSEGYWISLFMPASKGHGGK